MNGTATANIIFTIKTKKLLQERVKNDDGGIPNDNSVGRGIVA
jgi:hypothetical protein